MKTFFRTRFALLPALCLSVALSLSAEPAASLTAPAQATGTATQNEVYQRVYRELASHPHRRVGSPELKASFEAIERELRAAGLSPQYQTFDSLSQKTDRLSLTYGGVPVQNVRMIDNGAATFVTDKPFSGPVFYLGAGSLDDLNGKNVKGAIVVIDCALPNADVREAFTHGASAAILVGDESISQWNLANVAFTSIALVPRVYVDRKDAQAAGLLTADGSQTAVLDARTSIEDVAGCNLWVELPSRSDWIGRLETPEVMVFSATVDTYGLTPDYSPQRRDAANAALLTQVACNLARKGPLNRRVIVAFFGSRYGALEGARFFYHAIDMADEAENRINDLKSRGEEYDKELLEIATLLEKSRENIIGSRDAASRDLQMRLKRQLVATANRLRSPISDLNIELDALRKQKEAGNESKKLKDQLARKNGQLNELLSERNAINALREQIVRKKFSATAEKDGKPLDVQRVYDRAMQAVVANLELRRTELIRMIANNKTWMELSSRFADASYVGHFDFDLSSAEEPWMFTIINSHALFRSGATSAGSYGRHLASLGSIYYGENGNGGIAKPEWKAQLYKPALTPTFKPFSLAIPAQRVVPTSLATTLGVASFQLLTVGDSLVHNNLPFAEDYDLSPLCEQMTAYFREIGNSIELSLRSIYSRERLQGALTYCNGKGVRYQNYAPGSTDSEGIPSRAIVYLTGYRRPASVVGQSDLPRSRILANGQVYIPYISLPVSNVSWAFRNLAVGYDENGKVDRISKTADMSGIIKTPVHLFYAYGGLAFSNGFAPDPIGGDFYQSKTYIASKDAVHKTSATIPYSDTHLKEFYADRRDPIKIIGPNGDMLLGSVTNAPGVDPVKAAMGLGVPIDGASRLRTDNIAIAANDSYLLNEMRLDVLRNRNIVRDDLEKLHADARDHIEAAEKASSQKNWSLARAHQILANCIENRIYRPLRAVTEDLVQAVVVLLLLNIPFAFAMERLCIGATSIYRQILGFVTFFLATFGILYITHPAFSLASAPIVIFLAFVIIMLACITTAIMMGKIKQEIKALQGMASTVHGVDSESSTTLSAILIGIAGMRNRPLKTFLTCVTVVLLTFTILVFASFSAQQGVVESYLGRGSAENRIELHRLSFLDLGNSFLDSVKTIYGDRFHVVRRGGLFPVPTRPGDTWNPTNPERMIFHPKSGESMRISAVMGLDQEEVAQSALWKQVCPDFGNSKIENLPPIYFPPAFTNTLTQLQVGDEVRLNGIPFAFSGFFETGALQSITTIDDLRGVPPDFQSTLQNSGSSSNASTSEESLEEMSGTFEWFPPEVIALAPLDTLISDFNELCMVNFATLYPKSQDIDLEAIANELAPAFNGAIHVKSSEGAHRYYFTKAVEGSGFSDVVVPLLLGGLIIFSSLMGSIVAREKEIFTYSALGLAPVDVGALFFAESAVYSVIGGMGGYLISQLVAKLFKFLGSLGLITPLEMNFSSLTSVSTILIVMAVVMLSTIFPAMRASKSANPGVARKWKMPAPKGDKLEFVFPFTVSSLDFAGILSFIREHFNNHADATLGAFAARDVKLFREPQKDGKKDRIGIEANISLAPFDLGIFQRFRMYSQEFEIKGIDEVVVDLTRIGGTSESWIRSNRDFAAELREQFLLWRSLPIETIEFYRKATSADLGENPKESVPSSQPNDPKANA